MLLQMRGRNDRALHALGGLPRVSDGDGASLERAADELIARLRAERARVGGPVGRVVAEIDRAIRTDESELMDREEYPAERKVGLVRALDRFNRTLMSYQRFLNVLRPHLEAASARTERPARVLELASGSGEFTLALAQLAARHGLAVDVTGSDVVQAHVDRGNAEARARNVRAQFVRLNAFELDARAGDYDVVFIAQSAHHFTPGQLALLMHGGHAVAEEAFVLVDGYRSLWLLGFLAGAGAAASALMRSGDFLHDALVTGRRFFSEPELDLIARLACPGARVEVRTAHPGLSVLTVR
jgi:SAM-dependent methyltransferase